MSAKKTRRPAVSGRRRLLALCLVGAAVVVALAYRFSRTDRNAQPLPPDALRGSNVLLVTIDTLRADRVGVYGSTAGLTPTIDAFAREGLRFDRAYAHVPLTLPSHAALMTADYPPRNGVRDNGTFRLDASAQTLALRLQATGYRTGAFLGAFVLDARFGLNRGFDRYDDRMRGGGSEIEIAERRGEQVLTPAADWILGEQSPGPARQPFFVWVHLYDPHEPYSPPEPFRSRYSGAPYDGEVAYADAALGGFLGRLRSAGALDRTLIVIASDHGESLGDHGERTHGLFAYEATLRVPLVMWSAGRIRPGVFAPTMRLVDVAPTILDLVAAAPLTGVDGRSIRPFVAGERPYDDPGSYFEALNANLTRSWAPLTGLLREHLKLIDLPVPELYDLSSDPRESTNLYARAPEAARDLKRRLDAVTRAAPAARSNARIDADAEMRLRSLGYVVGAASKRPRTVTVADDPKRLVHLNAALDEADAAWSMGDANRAIALVEAAIKERADFTLAYDRLAHMLAASGRRGDAVAVLEEALRGGHADTPLLRSLGTLLADAGDAKRAASVLEPLVAQDPSDLASADALGRTYARLGRTADAETLFKRVLTASPNAVATWNNLGALYMVANRSADAADALRQGLAINPDSAIAHNSLGVAYARLGKIDLAVAEWRRALELRPGFPDAEFNLERAGK